MAPTIASLMIEDINFSSFNNINKKSKLMINY